MKLQNTFTLYGANI